MVAAAMAVAAWAAATWGRLSLFAVAIPILVIAPAAVATIHIHHVTATQWVQRWFKWRSRHKGANEMPASPAPQNVWTDSGPAIGVLVENETLITMIELVPDPTVLAVVDTDEQRAASTMAVAQLASMLTINDLKLSSIDVISTGKRAAGQLAGSYQQMIGTAPAVAHRRTWMVLRIGIEENLPALRRRGLGVEACERAAATVCQRIADRLASTGIDAHPATAEQIIAANTALHTDSHTDERWTHLQSTDNDATIYQADPAHVNHDSHQWWIWPHARDVTTLIRLTSGPQVSALVRYRSVVHSRKKPMSGLRPLPGVQQQIARQFRIGCTSSSLQLPSAPLDDTDIVVPLGPTGPMIGCVESTPGVRLHIPLTGKTAVLCEEPLLFRQIALRATVTGRPMTVVTEDPDLWTTIVGCAVQGQIVDVVPEVLDDNVILVIDGECPTIMPDVTVITNDEAQSAQFELFDTDDEYRCTLSTGTGHAARIYTTPTNEERRLLGIATTHAPTPFIDDDAAAVYDDDTAPPPQTTTEPPDDPTMLGIDEDTAAVYDDDTDTAPQPTINDLHTATTSDRAMRSGLGRPRHRIPDPAMGKEHSSGSEEPDSALQSAQRQPRHHVPESFRSVLPVEPPAQGRPREGNDLDFFDAPTDVDLFRYEQ